MKFRDGIMLCTVIVELSGLMLCQPPRPRIVTVEVPSIPIVHNAVT